MAACVVCCVLYEALRKILRFFFLFPLRKRKDIILIG